MPNTNDTRQAGTVAAQAARDQHQQSTRPQQAAARRAQEVIDEAHLVSPEVAGSMGAPLDMTAGVSFEDGARPRDLPTPGEAPGGVPTSQVRNAFTGQTLGDMMAQDPNAQPPQGLPDDRDAVLVAHGVPAGQKPPQVTPRPPPVIPGNVPVEHPILTKLKEDLGLDSIAPVDVTVGGHKWTMALVNHNGVVHAARIADQLAVQFTDRALLYKLAIVSQGIVAMDGVPTYQVMSYPVPPGVVIHEPLRPPRDVKYNSAIELFDWLNDGTKTQLAEKLYDAYLDKLDRYSEVESYLDDPTSNRVRFECQEEGCSENMLIEPRYVSGTNDMHVPVCRWHGIPMELTSAEQELESPLP